MRPPLLAVLLCASTVACAEWAVEPARQDISGCYSITFPGSEQSPAPAPPGGLELTDRAFLADDARPFQIEHHRFDARAAHEAFFVYPDTAFRVAWWWVSEDDRRFGVGNQNHAAAFYIVGTVSADRLEGEMRRWLYDDNGLPLAGPNSWTVPISGRRRGCGE